MDLEFPEYPSVLATVGATYYMAAVEALKGVRQVFFDGETILLPESEVLAIEMLRSEFSASLVYGQCKEFEFATKARVAGISARLIRLGQAVHALTGSTADEMVEEARHSPLQAILTWRALYRSSMTIH